jgi:hypothetical protein
LLDDLIELVSLDYRVALAYLPSIFSMMVKHAGMIGRQSMLRAKIVLTPTGERKQA